MAASGDGCLTLSSVIAGEAGAPYRSCGGAQTATGYGGSDRHWGSQGIAAAAAAACHDVRRAGGKPLKNYICRKHENKLSNPMLVPTRCTVTEQVRCHRVADACRVHAFLTCALLRLAVRLCAKVSTDLPLLLVVVGINSLSAERYITYISGSPRSNLYTDTF